MNNSNNIITSIIQVPNSENAFTAIVEVEICNESERIKDFAIANPQSYETENPKLLLEKARVEATQVVQKKLHSFMEHPEFTSHTQHYNSDYRRKEEQVQSSEVKQYNHSTKKSISENQIKLINKLAGEKHRNINELCVNNYGKSLHELNSKEAHELIDSLKKR